MKLIYGIVLLALFSISSEAKLRLYSRALVEKHIADSLKRIDSLRVADSIRIADSLVVYRYKNAEVEIKKENIRKEKEMEVYKPVEIDSSERIVSTFFLQERYKLMQTVNMPILLTAFRTEWTVYATVSMTMIPGLRI